MSLNKDGIGGDSEANKTSSAGALPLSRGANQRIEPRKLRSVDGFFIRNSNFKPKLTNSILDIKPIPEAQPTKPEPPKLLEATTEETSPVIAPALEDDHIEDVIEDIVVSESNDLLTAEDATIDAISKEAVTKKKKAGLKQIFLNKKLFFVIGLILIAIFAFPYTRYLILGQFIKNQYQFEAIDSTANTPVSGVTIKVNNKTLTTNSAGIARVVLGLGSYKFSINKQYYLSKSGSIFVGLNDNKPVPVKIVATGRQIPIKVVNKLTGSPLSGVEINILNTNAKTGNNGIAYVVLPTNTNSFSATLSYLDYQTISTNVKLSTKISDNTIGLVPTGSVYYLNSSSGVINVDKSDLDGSNQSIIVAGKSTEKANNTYLMNSPDQKYLILEAQRSGNQPGLYVINTANNQITEFDSSADSFTLIGWSGDQFLYDETNTSESVSYAGREQLKSYNALTQQLNLLDQDTVNANLGNYGYQTFSNFELLPTELVYSTMWVQSGTYDLNTLSDTIRGVQPNGLDKKDFTNFLAGPVGSIQAARYQPAAIYFSISNTATNQSTFYNYSEGALNQGTGLTSANFKTSYPQFYLSPSGEQSLWTIGDQTFVGDQNGQNQKLVNLPAGYTAYDWYDNVYILLSKDGNLYSAPSTGTSSPTLISAYVANPS
jgi:hypothetical protein